jgi:dethiobiotin synthetase
MTGALVNLEPGPRGVLIVTGTGTDVGKTVVTAAIAALARARGDRVAVVKPAQTGIAARPYDDKSVNVVARQRPTFTDTPGTDADTITRLSGVTDTHELTRFPDPLSPEAAARVSGLPPLDLADSAEYIARLADARDLVLVEGAGGLLVRYDQAGATIADLAAMLAAPVLVVAAAGLGTLNHTALTCEALAARRLELAGVAIGSWPRDPGLAERENVTDLEALIGRPLAGALPEGSGGLTREAFRAVAHRHLGPTLGGSRSPATDLTAKSLDIAQWSNSEQHGGNCVTEVTSDRVTTRGP